MFCGKHNLTELSFVVGVTHRGAICGVSWWYPPTICERAMQNDWDIGKAWRQGEYRCGDLHYQATAHFVVPFANPSNQYQRLFSGYVRQKRQVVERTIGLLKKFRLLGRSKVHGSTFPYDFMAQCFLFAVNIRNCEMNWEYQNM